MHLWMTPAESLHRFFFGNGYQVVLSFHVMHMNLMLGIELGKEKRNNETVSRRRIPMQVGGYAAMYL